MAPPMIAAPKLFPTPRAALAALLADELDPAAAAVESGPRPL
jgi:hypothetical protein